VEEEEGEGEGGESEGGGAREAGSQGSAESAGSDDMFGGSRGSGGGDVPEGLDDNLRGGRGAPRISMMGAMMQVRLHDLVCVRCLHGSSNDRGAPRPPPPHRCVHACVQGKEGVSLCVCMWLLSCNLSACSGGGMGQSLHACVSQGVQHRMICLLAWAFVAGCMQGSDNEDEEDEEGERESPGKMAEANKPSDFVAQWVKTVSALVGGPVVRRHLQPLPLIRRAMES